MIQRCFWETRCWTSARPASSGRGGGLKVRCPGWKDSATWNLMGPEWISTLGSLHLGRVKDGVMAKSRSSLTQRAGKGHLGRSLVWMDSQSTRKPTGCEAGKASTEPTAGTLQLPLASAIGPETYCLLQEPRALPQYLGGHRHLPGMPNRPSVLKHVGLCIHHCGPNVSVP